MIGGVLQTSSSPFLPAPARETGGESGNAAQTAAGRDGNAGGTGNGAGATTDVLKLSPEAQQRISELRQADAEVRQHEAAHQAAGGANAGGASFEYERGPDGKNYAVAGEVPVDLGKAGTPEATIAKMEQVKAAALAPAEPSPQDQRVASQADAIKADAQRELSQQRQAEAEGTGDAAEGGGKTDNAEGGGKTRNTEGGKTDTAESAKSASSDPATSESGRASGAYRRAAAAYGGAAAIPGIVGAGNGAAGAAAQLAFSV